jgi:hypothetical membrane protein
MVEGRHDNRSTHAMSRSRRRKTTGERRKRGERQFRRCINGALVGIGQFMLLCPMAILLYPQPFSLRDNFFSDLGCVVSTDEGAWWLHAWLFNGSLAALGLSLFLMFLSLVRVADRNGPGELLMCGGSGMLASASLVLVATFSWDSFPTLHTVAMLGWLAFMVPMLVGWLDWNAGRPRVFLNWLGRLVVLAVCVYPVVAAVAWGALAQKIVVCLTLLWLGVFVFQLRAAVRKGVIRQWMRSRRSTRTERRVRVRYVGAQDETVLPGET